MKVYQPGYRERAGRQPLPRDHRPYCISNWCSIPTDYESGEMTAGLTLALGQPRNLSLTLNVLPLDDCLMKQ